MKSKSRSKRQTSQQRRNTAPGNMLLAARTLSALTVVLRQAGLTVKEIDALCERALKSAESAPAKRAMLPPGKDSALLGSALAKWHRDPSYVTEQGLPRPLSLLGSKLSVQELLRKAGVNRRSREAAHFLRTAGLLLPQKNGKYLPAGRAARMPDINVYFAEHIALGMMKLMQTVQHNFTPRGKEKPLLQRAAAVRNLPRRHHAAFRQFINEQGNSFVTNVDDWLEARAVRGRTPKSHALPAGVYAFAYLG